MCDPDHSSARLAGIASMRESTPNGLQRSRGLIREALAVVLGVFAVSLLPAAPPPNIQTADTGRG
jgi:hypothetical protein